MDKDFKDLEQNKRATSIRNRILRLNDPPIISTLLQYEIKITVATGEIVNASIPDWLMRHVPSAEKIEYLDTVSTHWLRNETAIWYQKALRLGVPYFITKGVIKGMEYRERQLLK